ncbi:MAG: hypothetical protein AAF828_01370 [Bacteroidota bacterium]
MKNIMICILFFLCWLASGHLLAQLRIERQVIASGGHQGVSVNYQLSSTTGEIATTALSDDNRQLTQGFQQTQQLISEVIDLAGGIEVKLFPNPTTDFATLEINLTESTPLHFILVDVMGRPVERTNIPEDGPVYFNHRFDLRNAPGGTYFIKVLGPSGRILKTLRLVNIN